MVTHPLVLGLQAGRVAVVVVDQQEVQEILHPHHLLREIQAALVLGLHQHMGQVEEEELEDLAQMVVDLAVVQEEVVQILQYLVQR